MAQIVTITNPLTGQPAQVDQLEHTAQEIDDAIARAIPSTDHPGCYYRMIDGVTEWVNPPMMIGIEYRTTERYLGKPVYVKVVNFGNYPTSGTKTVAHKISNVRNIVSCLGTSSLGNSVNGYLYVSVFYADKTNINITVTDDVSNNEVKVMLKYTKTTD